MLDLKFTSSGRMARITNKGKERAMAMREAKGLDWNARRGSVWADLQPLLDQMFSPFEAILVDASVANGARDVLDIGCGTGAITLAFAERLAGHGSCAGVDISAPMLEVARSRTRAAGIENARFIEGDAQRFDFQAQAFDAVTSRFGIMFFDDPERAFANIRCAVRPGGALRCVAWRSQAENPFMIAADRAVAPILRSSEQSDPTAPGQFAFADATRVERLLRIAGWGRIELDPINVPCSLTSTDLAVYARTMGWIGEILPSLDSTLRGIVECALDNAFEPFLTGDVAQFDMACWLIEARAT